MRSKLAGKKLKAEAGVEIMILKRSKHQYLQPGVGVVIWFKIKTVGFPSTRNHFSNISQIGSIVEDSGHPDEGISMMDLKWLFLKFCMYANMQKNHKIYIHRGHFGTCRLFFMVVPKKNLATVAFYTRADAGVLVPSFHLWWSSN